MRRSIALTVSLMMGTAAAFAGDVQPLMVQRGALFLDESFAGVLDTKAWTVAIGEWRVENGALAGTERPADHHAAVIKTPLTNTTAVVQFSFLLKGQSGFHFSVNDPGGHNCRISVRANSIIMRRDLDKKDPRSYAPVLDESGAALAPDTWHTMIVELHGEELLARIDDAVFLDGIFTQAPEVKKAWEAFAAANQAKAQTKPAAGKK